MKTQAMRSERSPVRTAPFAPWPFFQDDEIEAAASVLKSGRVNYWTGEEGRKFEEEFARYVGCRYGVALANGTVALELALHALGIGPGDEVITSSRTFIASASAIVMRGATPIIADVDRESQNITVETVKGLITPRTRAIIAVHLAGWPCDMEGLLELGRTHGLKIIEDCAQAHGAMLDGRPVGSFGDAAAFSFCQDKIMTTGGEGGMLTTNDPQVWERAWSYKDHGKNYRRCFVADPPPGFRWLHDSFGTNWRLTEMQAALGRVALRKLPDWVARRRQNAAILTELFSGNRGLRVTRPPDNIGHAYYKYYAFVEPSELRKGWDRDRIMNALAAEGIPCYSGSCSEIYLEQAFDGWPWRKQGTLKRLSAAKELGEMSLMFLVHPTLGESDMYDVGRAVAKVFAVAARAGSV